jgi:hypothetical protein
MRKRSKYKPKGIRLDTMSFVKSGLMSFNDTDLAVDLRLKHHFAMEALRLGEATKKDIDMLIQAFNMTEALCRLREDYGKDWKKEIFDGHDALFAVSQRGAESSRFVCWANELLAIRLVMEIHDAQLDKANIKDLEGAMDIVLEDFRNKRMREIKRKTE